MYFVSVKRDLSPKRALANVETIRKGKAKTCEGNEEESGLNTGMPRVMEIGNKAGKLRGCLINKSMNRVPRSCLSAFCWPGKYFNVANQFQLIFDRRLN